VMDDFRIEGEEIPDLPIVGPEGFRIFEEVGATLGFRFYSTPRTIIDTCSIFNVFMRCPLRGSGWAEIEEVLGRQSEGVGNAVETGE
jgi:hypothetical protein